MIRGDLSPGQRIAQACHAAFDFSCSAPEIVAPWNRDSNYLVVLECPDRSALVALIERVDAAGLDHRVVVEPDYPEDEQLVAVAIEPGDVASRLCSSFPLAMREAAMV